VGQAGRAAPGRGGLVIPSGCGESETAYELWVGGAVVVKPADVVSFAVLGEDGPLMPRSFEEAIADIDVLSQDQWKAQS
jgi:hypothetical protein